MSKLRIPDPEGFGEFWSIWQPVCRESDGKPKARAAFTQHIIDGATPQDIIDGARWHIRQRQENKTLAYIQLASSWLNAERYEFEAEKERAYQARLADRAVNVVQMPVSNYKPKFLRDYERKQQEG